MALDAKRRAHLVYYSQNLMNHSVKSSSIFDNRMQAGISYMIGPGMNMIDLFEFSLNKIRKSKKQETKKKRSSSMSSVLITSFEHAEMDCKIVCTLEYGTTST